ncbi:MAG: ABC transporter permease [Deltaproteobacteria bacterium]|jgi:ABC-2 type transport system permease protein|nr:ABC transporter permease [Deltaproteobacteria bacterium]MBW2481630.1 ABC transporter permease [Deltaproteobacteria bacterium]
MNLRSVRAVARKEYYHLIRDFRSLYLAVMIPLLLILLFGYALSLDVEHIPMVVVDHDRTLKSRDFMRKLDATIYFDVVANLPNTAALIDHLDRNQALVGIVLPPGWSADLKADRQSPLQVIIDGSDPNYAGNTRAFITAYVAATNQEQLLAFLNRQGRIRIKAPVEGRIRVWFNEDLESRNFIIPGIIAIIIMIVAALLTSLVIAREYENGTMETIRSLPLGAVEFLAGKAIPYFFIALTDVLVAILMGQLLFGVVMKSSFWLMILASTIYIGVALGIGLLISAGVKSQLVANQMAIMLTYLPSLLLSDFVFPQENMPLVLKLVSRIVPATYFIDILNGLYLRNLGLVQLWPSYLVLAAMFALLTLINVAVLKKEGL